MMGSIKGHNHRGRHKENCGICDAPQFKYLTMSQNKGGLYFYESNCVWSYKVRAIYAEISKKYENIAYCDNKRNKWGSEI